jgi:hypothetical protein
MLRTNLTRLERLARDRLPPPPPVGPKLEAYCRSLTRDQLERLVAELDRLGVSEETPHAVTTAEAVALLDRLGLPPLG